MYWDTLIVLSMYLSLQVILGILTLIFTDQPGSRKTDVGTRGGNNVIPTHSRCTEPPVGEVSLRYLQ